MPLVSNEGNGQYWDPQAVGPVAQNYPPVTPPASIPANGSYSVGPLRSDGFKVLTVSAQLAAAGSLTIQRYIDLAGTIPQGPPMTLALSANTLGVTNLTDGLPYGSFQVTVANSGNGAAALSNFIILQTAQ